MKKIIMVIMVLMVMVFNLVGCNNESNDTSCGCECSNVEEETMETQEEIFEYDEYWHGENGKVYLFVRDETRNLIGEEMAEHGNLTEKDTRVIMVIEENGIYKASCHADLEFEDGYGVRLVWWQNVGILTECDMYKIIL